jgi:hypothetical protein
MWNFAVCILQLTLTRQFSEKIKKVLGELCIKYLYTFFLPLLFPRSFGEKELPCQDVEMAW